MKRRPRAFLVIAIIALFVLSGCAATGHSSSHFRQFTDLLSRYPQTDEPLRLQKLSAAGLPAASGDSDVFIMVHPAYSLFFRDANRSQYPEAKYALLSRQFNNEARFIREAAGADKILILIIPGNYATRSSAPLSYISYLNTTAGSGQSVFYLTSESASNGSISMNDMVELYHFLNRSKAGKVLIGGGFIGRCQREFYNQLTLYYNQRTAYIVPEISTISPDDISEPEAAKILESIEQQNYIPVRNFIDKKLNSSANFLSIPQTRGKL